MEEHYEALPPYKDQEVIVPRKILKDDDTWGPGSRHVVIKITPFCKNEIFEYDIKNEQARTRFNIETNVLEGVKTFEVFLSDEGTLDVRPTTT